MATTVSIDLTKTGSTSVDANGDPVYTTTYTTANPVNVPAEIFLYIRGTTPDDDVFTRVCALSDLTDYPSTRDPGYGYYRASTASVDHGDIISAKDHMGRIESAIMDLLLAQQGAIDTGFIGSETTTIVV